MTFPSIIPLSLLTRVTQSAALDVSVFYCCALKWAPLERPGRFQASADASQRTPRLDRGLLGGFNQGEEASERMM